MSCKPETLQSGDGYRPRRDRTPASKEPLRLIVLLIALFCLILIGFQAGRMILDLKGAYGTPIDAGKKNWVHTSYNNGTVWKGNPDESIYADMEELRCYAYYKYQYDLRGRVKRIDEYRKHDYNPDSWVGGSYESYKYDLQGRLKEKKDDYTLWSCEYSKEGRTETEHSLTGGSAGDDVYIYDAQGNLSAATQAIRYRYPHRYTYEYDGNNRMIRETEQIGSEDAYVLRTVEYDDANNTSLERIWTSEGELYQITRNVYDDKGQKTEGFWCYPEELPRGVSVEEYGNYSTRGYWAKYEDGLLIEEMTNESSGPSHSGTSTYRVYDYDSDGNCILELWLYRDVMYMDRYEYDGQGRLKEVFRYDCDDAMRFDRRLRDGSILSIRRDEESGEIISVSRISAQNDLIDQIVFDGKAAAAQYTPEGTVTWNVD